MAILSRPTARRSRDRVTSIATAQFRHIAETVEGAITAGQPAVSVDTKKKELVGAFKNGGREYRPAGSPEPVRVHDFVDPKLGRAAPYGVYDIADDKGWVSVGIDHDTAAFAVNAIRSWWIAMGRARYPSAHTLTITADGGGSNGSRVRLWKIELQKLADETGTDHRRPPSSARHQQMEQDRAPPLLVHLAKLARRPLIDYRTIVELIGATTSTQGLTVRCELDENLYPAGIKVSDEEMAALNIIRHDFHGEWNYTIKPRPPKSEP